MNLLLCRLVETKFCQYPLLYFCEQKFVQSSRNFFIFEEKMVQSLKKIIPFGCMDYKRCCWWRFMHTQQQFSRVYVLFFLLHALFYQWGYHTKVSLLLFLQNTYLIFARIRQRYQDFRSNVAIFPSILQAIHNHTHSAEG